MKRCIIFSRVSTELQNLDSQNDRLMECALKQGYSKDEIITIANKESGVRLSFIEREGIKELLKVIEQEPCIERVICWEVSRIARNPSVYYKVRDMLVEKKIQLQVITPAFELLNKDGSINEQASLIIGIFISLSESEARLMKERTKRGKDKAYNEGKFIGGGVTFGYKIENGYLVIDKDAADTVRLIFDMYIKGHSCQEIAKEMLSLGLLWHKKISAAHSYIFSLVRNPIYATGSSDNNYNYRTRKGLVNKKPTKAPRIITMEVWNKAQEINLRDNPYKAKRQRKNIYFAHGIITDKRTGAMLGPDSVKWVYRTCLSERERGVKMLCINIDMVDSLLWHITKQYVEENKENDRHKTVLRLRDEQTKAFLKISTLEDKNEALQAQIDRIEERIISGRLDEDKGNEMQEKRYGEMLDNEKMIDSLKSRTEEIQYQIEHLNEDNVDLNQVLTDESRKELVIKYIHSVEVERLDGYNFNIYVNGICYEMNTHQKTKTIKYKGKLLDYELIKRKGL